MNKTSDKAVSDYLSNMFMDLTISDTETPPVSNVAVEYSPLDSVQIGSRLIPCLDPFKLMALENASLTPETIYLAYLSILNFTHQLPEGYLKQYSLRQCQTLQLQLTKYGQH